MVIGLELLVELLHGRLRYDEQVVVKKWDEHFIDIGQVEAHIEALVSQVEVKIDAPVLLLSHFSGDGV